MDDRPGDSGCLSEAEMKIQQKIPVFFRVPLAVLSHALFSFGPVSGLLVVRPFGASPWLLIGIGIAWLLVFDRLLMSRLDCFWNVRCMQNRSGKPPFPDNHREFRTAKGWLGWLFLGKDYETAGSATPVNPGNTGATHQGGWSPSPPGPDTGMLRPSASASKQKPMR